MSCEVAAPRGEDCLLSSRIVVVRTKHFDSDAQGWSCGRRKMQMPCDENLIEHVKTGMREDLK